MNERTPAVAVDGGGGREKERGNCARAGIVARGSTALAGFSQPLREDRRGPRARRHINERLRCLACPTQIGSGRCSVARERGFIELGKKPLNQEGKGRKEGSEAGKGRHRRGGAGGLAGTRTQEEGRKEEGSRRWEVLFWEEAVALSLPPSLLLYRRECLPTTYLPTFPSFPQEQRPRTKSSGMGGRKGERKLGQRRPRLSLLAQRSSLVALNEVAFTRLSSLVIRRRAAHGPHKTFPGAEKCQPTRTCVIRCR